LSVLGYYPVTRHRIAGITVVAVLGLLLLVTFGPWNQGRAERRQAQLELAEQLEDLFASVADDVRPSVVAIDTTDGTSGGATDVEGSLHTSFGSGFIVDARGYILTNQHLVAHAKTIRVRLYDGREFSGVRLRGDETSDIAFVKIEADNLRPARLGNSDKLRVGQWALAVGHPFGLMQTVSAGIVSALKRSDLRLLPFEDFIQTDASINPGNSGGPLVNLRGEVIGINTAIYSTAGSMNHGISFAIPINLAKALTTRWIEGKNVAFLGLSPMSVDTDMSRYFGLGKRHGAFVRGVDKDGPAENAGIQTMDLIVKFDREVVEDENHLRVLIALQSPGSEVEVEVLRGRETRKLVIVPSVREDRVAVVPGDARGSADSERWLGITVTTLTKQLVNELGAGHVTRGVAVVGVGRDTPSWRKGIRPGDILTEVNGSQVSDLVELERELMAAEDVVALRVSRRGRDAGFFFVPRG
jgi:serine protease Do